MARAGIDERELEDWTQGPNKMAAPGRTSSLTDGSTMTNDVFEKLLHKEVPVDVQPLQLVRKAVHLVEASRGQPSRIFKDEEGKLRCDLRAHIFPPKNPNGAPAAGLERMQWGQLDWQHNLFRECDHAEGGRLHGHRDQKGTDGVVLLNLGACDFFVDVVQSGRGGCKAQRTKECWCTGNGGHWVTRADCMDRYQADDGAGNKKNNLLIDRKCKTCAAGGKGQACPHCVRNTVRLRSGDVLAFSGRGAFHGVSAVVREQPPPPSQPFGVPALPSWAEKFLKDGWRVSVQWRLTNAAVAEEQAAKETEQYRKSATASRGAGGGGKRRAVQYDPDVDINSDDSDGEADDSAGHGPVARPSFAGEGRGLGGSTEASGMSGRERQLVALSQRGHGGGAPSHAHALAPEADQYAAIIAQSSAEVAEQEDRQLQAGIEASLHQPPAAKRPRDASENTRPNWPGIGSADEPIALD